MIASVTLINTDDDDKIIDSDNYTNNTNKNNKNNVAIGIIVAHLTCNTSARKRKNDTGNDDNKDKQFSIPIIIAIIIATSTIHSHEHRYVWYDKATAPTIARIIITPTIAAVSLEMMYNNYNNYTSFNSNTNNIINNTHFNLSHSSLAYLAATTAANLAVSTSTTFSSSSAKSTSVVRSVAATYPTSSIFIPPRTSSSSLAAAAIPPSLSSSSSIASQENNSFLYDESDVDVINRSLLLSNVSAASINNSADGAEGNASLIAEAEWSHFYDLILSWQGICLITVFCIFIVITIIGNTLVILAVITTRRLKTVTNCFVMSLAVADLLVGIFVMPPAVAVHLIGSWQLGWILCDIWISLDVLLCTASILSLSAISIDRYLAVTQPLTYSRKRRSKRLALIMILVVWALALAITCPPMLGWYEPGRRDLSECRYNQNEGYVIFSAMGSFFIPMAVMIYVYARISCVISSRHDNMTDINVHNKKFKRYTSADVDNDHDFSEQDLSTSTQKKQAAARTFSNQTIAREFHDVLLSDGENCGSISGGGGGNTGVDSCGAASTQCHSMLALSTTNTKNGCYELTRPASFRHTPTESSTMTTMTSSCGGAGIGEQQQQQHWPFSLQPPQKQQQKQEQQQLTRPQSMRYHHHNHHHHHHNHQQQQHHLNTSSALGNSSSTIGGGGSLQTSPHLQDLTSTTATAMARQTRVHSHPHHHHNHHNHHNHHHQHQHGKSFSNRITSLKKENKTTRTLSIVVGGFIACWLPFFIYYLITPFLEEHQVSRTLAKVLTWLGWFNSAINPFIYAFYSVDFRAAFWRLTCKRFFTGSMKPQFPTNTMSIRR